MEDRKEPAAQLCSVAYTDAIMVPAQPTVEVEVIREEMEEMDRTEDTTRKKEISMIR